MSALTMSATLLDISRLLDKDGKVATIIEMLQEDNEVLNDMMWIMCNEGTNHKSTQRNGLPTVYYRKYNKGTPASGTTTTQITDPTAMLEGRSNVDAALLQINAGQDAGKAFRMSQDTGFLEAMNQQFTKNLFYGSSEDSEEFVGFSERFNEISTDDTESGYNVIDAGGTGNNLTSLWLIGWGDRSAHGIYPKGETAGFNSEDLGKREVKDDDGNEFTAYTSKYTWYHGLAVTDWRYIVRIANIDVDDLKTSSAADLITLMTLAEEQVPQQQGGVRFSFYANKVITTYLRLQMQDKTRSNASLGWVELQGKKVRAFNDTPIRRVDQLLTTEDQVI